jgi:hypothetical protein
MRFLVSENLQLQKNLLFNYLKVLTCLKKFNSSDNYTHTAHFFFRNFSFHNTNHAYSVFKLKLLILLAFVCSSALFFWSNDNLELMQTVKRFSVEENLDFLMLFCVTVSLAFVIVEIVFRRYQSVKFFGQSKVTSKVLLSFVLGHKPHGNAPPVRPPPDSEHTPPKTKKAKGRIPGKVARNFDEMVTQMDQQEDLKRQMEKRRVNTARLTGLLNRVLTCVRVIRRIRQRGNMPTKFKHNPHLRKYFSSVVFWLVAYLTLFLVHPLTNGGKDPLGFLNCLKSLNNSHARLLMVLVACYVALDCFENNRYRRNNYESILDLDFKSPKSKMVFWLECKVPFFLEIRTVLNFISCKTALGILKWYQIENIKMILLNAKFINEEQKKKVVGHEESRLAKAAKSTGLLLLFFLLLVCPFWMFSSLSPMTKMPVLHSVSFEVGVESVNSGTVVQNSFLLASLSAFHLQSVDELPDSLGLNSKNGNVRQIMVR